MIIKRAIAASIVACLSVTTQAFAQSVTFGADDAGKSVSVDYDGSIGGQAIDFMGSSATFTRTGVDDTFHGDTPVPFFNFDYAIANTSSVQSELSSFAFRTNPANYEIGFVDGAFEDFEGASTFPNNIGPVDACFGNFGNPSNCGTTDTGIYPGDIGFGTFRLAFYDAISSLTFDDFFVRYAQVGGPDNAAVASGRGTVTGVSSGGSPVEVPEPGMLAIFASSLALLFARQGGFAKGRRSIA